jgi:methionyl-tRNA synthetase
MAERYYVTTPIYYVNDAPHIGTGYCTMAADVLARFHRLLGEEVLFATGTDENAPKVVAAAAAAGQDPRSFVDEMAHRFRETWDNLGIAYDVFIRTTEERHARAAQHMFRVIRDRGDIYQGTYEGWYCLPCETYFADDEVVRESTDQGEEVLLCPECGRQVQRVSEVNYFFALSRYGDRLLQHIQTHPEFLQPEFRRNEVIQFVQAGLRDVCITRAASGWGIPVPEDPSQVIYVWFDALINYITAAGYPDDADRLRRWWPADLHLVGKDIYVRFHCTLWPAMLMAAGLELPRQVFGHGFWLNEGVKISKSLGNAIDLFEETANLERISGCRREIAIDALRYFLFRQVPFGQDADFSRAALAQRFNGDLANDLGNALHRSLHLTAQNFERRVPPTQESVSPLSTLAAQTERAVATALRAVDLQQGLTEIWKFIAAVNKYLDGRAPWNLAKQGRKEELGSVLYAALESCRLAAVWIAPYMPSVAAEMARQLGVPAPARWQEENRWGLLRAGEPLCAPEPIFPRIDRRSVVAAAPGAATSPPPSSPGSPEPLGREPISIDDFARVEMRVVDIIAAERVPKADKLLQIRVSLGTEERTVLAGLAEYYTPDSLVGRKAILVANLAPRKMRGIESQGMLLAAEAGDRVALLQPDQNLPAGATVR